MSDAELAEFLVLSPSEAAIIIPKLTPSKRAMFERMSQVCFDIELWESGAGPRPEGVILCHEHKGRP